ncbi:MAG: YgeY family selenium metabolism-linked hydrolase [Deltaproteobacteria bacterium]|nr:YgeY family selenium metabolism-linked hydrolase [Deltaproteobacteria bacterium]
MSDLFAKIIARARELEADTARFLCDMVRVPSLSCGEKGVVDVIVKEMRAAGFDEVRVDGLGSVIGRIGSGPRVVAFDAHIDTVDTGDLKAWRFHPFEPKVEGGKVWGRGTVDQEGGMASMVAAGRIIRELGLGRGLTVLFAGTVMEEDCDGLCWQYLICEEKIRPELVVITEPTNLNIYRGHRGRMEIRVSFSGRSCHGSAPERGDNAIYKAARCALEIEKLNTRLASDPFLGKGTVTISQATSSSPSLCAVADGATLHLDRRLTKGETKESAVAEVRDAAARAGLSGGDFKVEVLTYDEKAYTGLVYPTEKYYPTWTLDETSPYLVRAREVYRGLFDREPLVDKWTFSTNGVAIAGMHGIPCIGLGPGNEVHAHAPNEACPLEHLSGAAAFYAGLVETLDREGR